MENIIYFVTLFNFLKFYVIKIVSGDVKLDYLSYLYLIPSVPIEVPGIRFILFKIDKIKITEVFPLVPVTAIIFFGFKL